MGPFSTWTSDDAPEPLRDGTPSRDTKERATDPKGSSLRRVDLDAETPRWSELIPSDPYAGGGGRGAKWPTRQGGRGLVLEGSRARMARKPRSCPRGRSRDRASRIEPRGVIPRRSTSTTSHFRGNFSSRQSIYLLASRSSRAGTFRLGARTATCGPCTSELAYRARTFERVRLNPTSPHPPITTSAARRKRPDPTHGKGPMSTRPPRAPVAGTACRLNVSRRQSVRGERLRFWAGHAGAIWARRPFDI